METTHPVDGSFGCEFPPIYNQCGVMDAWSRKMLKKCKKFLHFGGKTTPCCTIFKILFWTFLSASPIEMLCANFVKFGWRKWVKSCVAYLTKKKWNFAWLSSCHYCADRAQILPGPAPDSVLGVLQISSKSVHFWRSYGRMREHRQNVP